MPVCFSVLDPGLTKQISAATMSSLEIQFCFALKLLETAKNVCCAIQNRHRDII
jgi:hypothetical protein